MFKSTKRILFACLVILATLLFAVPVAADKAPEGQKPTVTRTPPVSYKGVVTEKGEFSFTLKTDQKVIKIGVNKDTRFFKDVLREKPPATTKPPVTTTRTPEKEKPSATRQPPKATATTTKKPENTTVRAVPTKSPPAGEPYTQVTFKDLAVGDYVAVETNGNTEQPLAKTVRIAAVKAPEPKPAPTKALIRGIVTSVNEERMAFTIKTASGETMTFKYEKGTVFSLLGSASLKAGMEVEVFYLVSSGPPVALGVKMMVASAPESTVKK